MYLIFSQQRCNIKNFLSRNSQPFKAWANCCSKLHNERVDDVPRIATRPCDIQTSNISQTSANIWYYDGRKMGYYRKHKDTLFMHMTTKVTHGGWITFIHWTHDLWMSTFLSCESVFHLTDSYKCVWWVNTAVFWVVAPCSLVEVYRRFRGTCYCRHQGDE
jgi:hypothetical protein